MSLFKMERFWCSDLGFDLEFWYLGEFEQLERMMSGGLVMLREV